MVVHNYNPSYAGGLSRRVIIWGRKGGGGEMGEWLKW
jgi:hypothetical protein